MSDINAEAIFNELYSHVDGYEISAKGRNKLDYYYVGHTYGEIVFADFAKMLSYANPQPYDVFYDLGSGTGKAVMTAALLYPFAKVEGVELIKELYDASQLVLANYREQILPENPQLNSNIIFKNEDFAKTDFSDATVMYVNATCFSYEFTPLFLKKIDNLKQGTRIITNSVPIEVASYRMQSLGIFQFSWGNEPVYLHVKI